MTTSLKRININIWDDFYDDGYVPAGEKQKTYIYIEEDDKDVSLQEQKECIEYLLKYILKNLNTSGVKLRIEHYDSKKKYPHLNENDNPWFMKQNPNFHFTRWEIRTEGLTHKRLDEWMHHFEKVTLRFKQIPLNIFSES